MLVFIINKNGKPLMPCTSRTARILLKENKAKVIRRTPFTIKLLNGSSGYKQEVTLGVDAGSKTIGLSAVTKNKELYSAEVVLRTDIVDLLSTRSSLRKTRRSRKTRYRKPRFNNRVKSKNKGWLAPSIDNKIEAHLKTISFVHKLLPISKVVVEVASFDIQKIKNPDIQGIEYQQGEQLDFWNIREYVLFRDNHTCQHCKGKSKDKILNVHHIESRKTGGDAPNNLITLCNTCHDKHHKGLIEVKVKRGTSFRDAAFMGIMRWNFYNKLKSIYPNVNLTYGYITKKTRISNNLPKEHRIDARCITGKPNVIPSEPYLIKQVRMQNRQLHKLTILKGGIRKSNKASKYVFGFQLFDKVLYQNQECFIFGRRSSGSFDIRLLNGTVINAGVSYKKLKLIERAKSMLIQKL